MNNTFSENQFETNTTARPIWDLDEMVDKVRRSLHEEVDPLMVRQALIDVLADYEDARILTFIPILACRGAEEKLKKKVSAAQIVILSSIKSVHDGSN